MEIISHEPGTKRWLSLLFKLGNKLIIILLFRMLSIYTLSSFAVGVACGFLIRRQWVFLGNILLKTKPKQAIDTTSKKSDEYVSESKNVSLRQTSVEYH